MKKLLLSVLALSLSAGSFAQNRVKQTASLPIKQMTPGGEQGVINAKPAIPLRSFQRNGISPGVNALIDIGNSPNALTSAFGPKTALFAHPLINTVTMIYRNDMAVTGSGGSGDLRYGISTDGGATWSANQGPIYVANVSGASPMAPARYPQAVIYNPSGNTTPANAFISYAAPSLAGTNDAWGGLVHGSAPLGGGGTATQTEVLTDRVQVPNTMMIAPTTNNSYVVDIAIDFAVLADYVDSVLMFQGVWNGTTNQYDYTLMPVYAPVAGDGGSKRIVEARIAFSPNSNTGYMTILGHYDFSLVADSNYAPIIMKTTDGGATWTHRGTLALDNIDQAFSLGNTTWTTGFEHDLVVDVNNNAHMIMAIGPSTNSFSIGTTPGEWGIFDIYTTDQGVTWFAQLLGMPQTFRYTWGSGGTSANAEDSRPQVATNWTGDKVFFVWFDTDTATFGTNENAFPDAHAVGYDVTANMWTAEVNLTTGTDADGACSWGSVSPYVFEPAAGTYNIPIAIATIADPNINIAPTTHKYITDANILSTQFTVAGVPIPLTSLGVGVQEVDANINSLSVYPNPASGRSNTIAFEMDKTAGVTVELVNTIGQTARTVDYGVLNAGVQKLNLDVQGLHAGIYIVKVKAGENVAVKKITVK